MNHYKKKLQVFMKYQSNINSTYVLYYEFIIRLKIVCVYVIMASIVISKSSEYVKQYNKEYYMMNKSRHLAYVNESFIVTKVIAIIPDQRNVLTIDPLSM